MLTYAGAHVYAELLVEEEAGVVGAGGELVCMHPLTYADVC